MPDSKPDLHLDEAGVCSACNNFKKRQDVDWKERQHKLKQILAQYKDKKSSNWDCIVPVSGGKDSTFQVIKLLQLGANPLCVTATTCDLTDIGRKNIENIKNLGVDLLEFSPKPDIRRRLNLIGLEEVGDISWPEHVGIFTIPVNVAVRFNIPLIIWGENSQHEYGGPAAASESQILDRKWLEEFGGLLGLRVDDLLDVYGFKRGDLLPYIYPSDQELSKVGVTGLFLGYFVPWDGLQNVLIAQANGFSVNQNITSGSMVNYENLDNYQVGIHDYFKYLKFGFGRASDLASLHIRRGRLLRDDAIEIVKRLDGVYPEEYLGKSLESILSPLGISRERFDVICDTFTNPEIFKSSQEGAFMRDHNKKLIKIREIL